MTLAALRAWGVVLLNPADGRIGAPQPVASGTGATLAADFDPQWVVGAVGPAPSCG